MVDDRTPNPRPGSLAEQVRQSPGRNPEKHQTGKGKDEPAAIPERRFQEEKKHREERRQGEMNR